MRHLYQSNRLEVLLTLFLQLSRVPLTHPLSPECIIVQSRGVARWLEFEIARQQGIAANLDIRLPASFIGRLTQVVSDMTPTRSVFSPEILVWQVLVWLETSTAQSEPRLSTYLKDSSAHRRYALARRIADLFDHYLLYRTDWLTHWRNGKTLHLGPDEHWQAALWRDLVRQGQYDESMSVQSLLAHPDLAHYLPERITLFGIAYLPPSYLAFFEHLSCHIDVCFFALNPCQHYWGNLYGGNLYGGNLYGENLSGEKTTLCLTPSDVHPQAEQSLLAKMGRHARFFFDHLAQESELHSLFVSHTATQFNHLTPSLSLLHQLQENILTLETSTPQTTAWMANRPVEGSAEGPVETDDDSLIISVCHSPQRELEALHDQLLDWFSKYPSLKPSDILVVCTDIDVFEPYIDAVFATRTGHPFIPWSIVGHQTTGPFIAAILRLFTLPQSRFGAQEILSWLEVPALCRHFGIRDSDFSTLDRWVRASGIRWGRDAAHRARLGLPADHAHTWRFGLDRLLLGVVLPVNPLQTWQGIAPAPNLSWHDSELLERFCQFVETLESTADTLAQPASAKDWQQRLLGVFGQLFDPDDTEAEVGLQLRHALTHLVECVDAGAPHLLLTREWVHAELSARLHTRRSMGGLCSGGVTFCSMALMRSVPFKRIAVLGLNDGLFPCNSPKMGFDLMAQHPRSGDFIQKWDDRYAFLEILLAAREGLYLSYVGRSVHDHSRLPPSVFLLDLLDVIGRGGVCSNALPPAEHKNHLKIGRHHLFERITHIHRLQAFHPDYFSQSDLPRSYSRTWLSAAKASASVLPYASMLNAPLPAPPPSSLEDERKAEEGNAPLCCVRLETLIASLCNTSRFYLRERLHVHLPWLNEVYEDEEPFSIDYRAARELSLLVGSVSLGVGSVSLGVGSVSLGVGSLSLPMGNAVSEKEALSFSEASGWLPHGIFGQLMARDKIAEGQRLAHELAKIPRAEIQPSQPWTLKLPEGEISGVWVNLTTQGLSIALTEAEPKPATRLAIWLQHLSLCALAPAGVITQTWIATPERLHCLSPIPHAMERLLDYWEAWKRLHEAPLPFFPKTSSAYVMSRDPKSALYTAKKEWNPSPFKQESWQKSESEDPWHALLWRGSHPLEMPWRAEFTYWAHRLWPSEEEWGTS